MRIDRVCVIEWLDAVGGAGWHEADDDYKHTPISIKSVGFVYEDTAEYITIVQSYDIDLVKIDNYITIPKGMVKKRKWVKLP